MAFLASSWEAWRNDTSLQICRRTADFAIFMHKVKYTTPDGIEHKQMNYFYIILAQIKNICRLNHLILELLARTSLIKG